MLSVLGFQPILALTVEVVRGLQTRGISQSAAEHVKPTSPGEVNPHFGRGNRFQYFH